MRKRAALAAIAALTLCVPAVAPVSASALPVPAAQSQTWTKAPMCFGELKGNPLQVKTDCWKRWPEASTSATASPGLSVWLIINRACWVLIGMLSLRLVCVLVFSSKHHRNSKKLYAAPMPKEQPLVSIIVPCYNEEETLANCVNGLANQSYPNVEIVLVDDGSKDDTYSLAQALAGEHGDMVALSKENGGKASALRYGVHHSHGPLIICIDADSIFAIDAVEQIVKTFADPAVDAVGGNVRVANRNGILTACQALDYIIGLNSNGRAYSVLGCMQVIPGAVGAFRREPYYAVGGHSDDTLVEDMDLTIAFAQSGYRVVYNPHALAYTEAPVHLKDFVNQRYRWTYGGMQVLGKYRKTFMFKWHPMSLIGLPMHTVSPWLNIVVSMLLANSAVAAIVYGKPGGLLIFLGALYVLQFSMLCYMLTIDHESKRFLLMTGVETVFYLHLLNFVTLRAGFNYLLKRKVTWQKIPRLGANQLTEGKEHAEAHHTSPAGDLDSVHA